MFTSDNSQVIKGIKDAIEIVKASYGPNAGNVAVVDGTANNVFDDGYMALRSYRPLDIFERYGVSLVLDAAESTWRNAGDGTSTTAILAASFMELATSDSPEYMAQRLQYECDLMIKALEENSAKINDDIRESCIAVAKVAMHGDEELANLIGELVFKVGKNGVIRAEPSKDNTWSTTIASGLQWEQGVPSDRLLNNRGSMRYDNAHLLFVDGKLESIKDSFWQSVFASWKAVSDGAKPLVIVCNEATGSFLETMAENAASGKPVGILTLTDSQKLSMAADICGAKVFRDTKGSLRTQSCLPADFGRCEMVSATMETSTIVPCEEAGEVITAKVSETYSKFDILENPDMDRRDDLVSFATGCSGIIRVPFITRAQFSADKEKIEDGYRAAMNTFDGVLPGAGCAYKFVLDGPNAHEFTLDDCFMSPLRAIFGTVNMEEAVTLVNPDSYFYGKSCLVSGIIDTKKTLIEAVRNACSAAIPFIKTKIFILNE